MRLPTILFACACALVVAACQVLVGIGDRVEASAVEAQDAESPAVPGKRCTGESECDGKRCVDGFCCDRACDGQCEACSVPGKEGTCSLVTGAPLGSRPSCEGTGACAGSCNGSAPTCTYPPSSIICGAACDGKCDGAGKCSSVSGGSCPGGYACGATGCLTTCSDESQCQPFHKCSGGKCELQPEGDCLDGKDNNGDGLADCADPSCNAAVKCVPVASAGGEVGVFLDDGATCPVEYPTKTAWHAGLNANTCTGCSCQTRCTATATLWSSNDTCSGTGTTVTTTDVPTSGSSVKCTQIVQANYKSARRGTPSIGGCVGAGTATQADPSWTTNKTFCAARSSATCGDASKVCVAVPATKLCARGNQGACPTGYADDKGAFYTGFDKGRCDGSCASCTPATAGSFTCLHKPFTPVAYKNAGNCTGLADTVPNACDIMLAPNYLSVGIGFDSSGTDNCTNNITNVPPTPTGGAQICCEP